MAELGAVFDALPDRHIRQRIGGGGEGGGGGDGDENGDGDGEGKGSKEGRGVVVVQHRDAKRVLLAMKAHEGGGGDGTVVYYIVQEGEVKPRQN